MAAGDQREGGSCLSNLQRDNQENCRWAQKAHGRLPESKGLPCSVTQLWISEGNGHVHALLINHIGPPQSSSGLGLIELLLVIFRELLPPFVSNTERNLDT